MKVPKSLDHVSVEQFQEIFPIVKSIENETDSERVLTAWCSIISFLAGCTPEDVEALPITKIKEIIKTLNWVNNPKIRKSVKRYLYLGGVLYKLTPESEMTTAQYIEIKTWLQRSKSATPELHNILASIYSPLTKKGFIHDGKNHALHAKRFRKAKMGKVYPTVFFYSNALKNWIKNTQDFGIQEAQKQMKEAERILAETLKESLESIGDGMR